MQCREFVKYSERWMDGERDAAAQAHVESCSRCSALLADLQSIASSAAQLAEADPPERVWVSLRNQLEIEGLIQQSGDVAVVLPSHNLMPCHEFVAYSERWMDGERDAAAQAHVQSCVPCATLIADLESIASSAVQLAEADAPERVWVLLRNQLEIEGLIHQSSDVAVVLPSHSLMQCHEFVAYSERWMDGERDAAAQAHVKACVPCSALIADLEAISQSAGQLAEADPPERVWVSLRNQMEIEGLVHEPEDAAVALPGPSRPGFVFGLRPALATAFLAVLFVFVGLYGLRDGNVSRPGGSISGAIDPSRDGREVLVELAALGLAQATVPELHEHNPAVQDAYRENLQIVDNAIAMCEKTLQEQPQNEIALDYLRAAYHQKADLLASMSQRGALGD